jgi:hypothetical protein
MVNERLIKQRREEALEIRKKLWWMLPFLVGLAAFSWWITVEFVVRDFGDLIDLAPGLRLEPIIFLTPLMGLIAVMLFALHVLKAIPYNGIWTKRLVGCLTTTVLLMFGLMILLGVTSSMLQNHYMPKLGYNKCLLLQGGGFSLSSTDWVKNPDWCVKGKTREWVNEQAALQASKGQTAP